MVSGCGGSGEEAPAADAALPELVDAGAIDARPDAAPVGPPTAFGGARPATLQVPPSYDPATPMPLVVALHGYADNNSYVGAFFGLSAVYQSAGFLLIEPKGTKDSQGKYFWNATDACCNFDGVAVDDVAYLNGLVDEIEAAYNVDPKRVYVVGHSNGGFMAYRMACETAGRYAAVLSVAGATYDNPASCTPSEPVNILQIHGTSDQVIHYDGGATGGGVTYPSAAGTTQRWATYNGCATTTRSSGAKMDLTADATAETDPVDYDGCPVGGSVELWTASGQPHLIYFKDGLVLWNWLKAHPQP